MTISDMFARASRTVESKLEYLFYNFGHFIGTRPKISILLSVLFAIVLSSGLNTFVEEDRPDKLWIPQDTEAMDDRYKYEEYFPKYLRIEEMIITSKADSDPNVLERSNLEEILLMWSDIEALTPWPHFHPGLT